MLPLRAYTRARSVSSKYTAAVGIVLCAERGLLVCSRSGRGVVHEAWASSALPLQSVAL